MADEKPKKRRRDYGDDGISWDKANKVWVGTVSLGFGSDGKRDRRTVRAKTKTEVKERLGKLNEEIKAGIRTPATYTVALCVADWLDSIERDPHTIATFRGQAENGSIRGSARPRSRTSPRPTPTPSSRASQSISASGRS
jgi:hypothetical protein